MGQRRERSERSLEPPVRPPSYLIRLSGRFTPLPHDSYRRFDVRIEAEEVGRVILVLQAHEPLVVRPIGCSDSVVAFLREVIDIHPASREWPHEVPCLAH